PTPTPPETPTPTATPTPTPTPTATPTLPSEQVGGLQGVPDPRVTAPELFDLHQSDAPIPQFVYTMRMAGIEVSGEEVAARMEYRPISGVDGRP
ncbi:MAG: hypothetical protein ACUVX8_19040, partial [Candidatus Zipacnadales bacterium]